MQSKQDIEKLGNALIMIVDKVDNPSPTKLLKLVYLLEETSIRRYGIPMFNLNYEVWKFGPVAQELYVEFTDRVLLLDKYIERTYNGSNVVVKSKAEFSDGEFNDLELELLEDAIEKLGKLTGSELIDITHRKGSLWYETAKANGVLELLLSQQMNTTNFQIDFAQLFSEKDNSSSRLNYLSYLDFQEDNRQLCYS
jgi:uncharacterized phage-associated protein